MIQLGYYYNLPANLETELAIRLAKFALPSWEKYASDDNLIYTDSEAGSIHKIERNILPNAIKEMEDYIQLSKDNDYSLENDTLLSLYENFEEPMAALRDCDWELPDDVEKTFYGVFNLLTGLMQENETVQEESSLQVSINQFIEAIEASCILSEEQIVKIIEEVKNMAD
jgi:hypothetical protein